MLFPASAHLLPCLQQLHGGRKNANYSKQEVSGKNCQWQNFHVTVLHDGKIQCHVFFNPSLLFWISVCVVGIWSQLVFAGCKDLSNTNMLYPEIEILFSLLIDICFFLSNKGSGEN